MRRIRRVTSVFFVLAVSAIADQFVRTLRVSVNSLAIRPRGGDTPTRVLFVGTSGTATVTFAVAALPWTRITPGKGFRLPFARWWEGLTWEVRRDGAASAVIVKPVLEREESLRPLPAPTAAGMLVPPGESLTAILRLPILQPGAYTIRVSLAGVQAEPYRLLVSTGGETPDLRREYARYKTLNSPNAAVLKQNLLELAALDPLNAGPWIQLGDLALHEGSSEEIRGYYEHAISVLDERRKMFAAKGATRVVAAIDTERSVVEQVRQLVPRYVASRTTLDLHIERDGGKRYVLTEKATGRVVQVISAPAPFSGVR